MAFNEAFRNKAFHIRNKAFHSSKNNFRLHVYIGYFLKVAEIIFVSILRGWNLNTSKWHNLRFKILFFFNRNFWIVIYIHLLSFTLINMFCFQYFNFIFAKHLRSNIIVYLSQYCITVYKCYLVVIKISYSYITLTFFFQGHAGDNSPSRINF